MTSQVKNVSLILSVIGAVVTSVWYYQTRELEPLAALIFSIVTIIGLCFIKDSKKKASLSNKLHQKAGDNSNQYQAGRDIDIKN